MISTVYQFVPRDAMTSSDRIEGLVFAFNTAELSKEGSIHAAHVMDWSLDVAEQTREEQSPGNVEKQEQVLDTLVSSFASLTALKNTI